MDYQGIINEFYGWQIRKRIKTYEVLEALGRYASDLEQDTGLYTGNHMLREIAELLYRASEIAESYGELVLGSLQEDAQMEGTKAPTALNRSKLNEMEF